MSTTKRISVSEVECGMYIQRLDGSWLEHPFWRRSFLIKDRAVIKVLHESGVTHVFIDTAKGKDVAVLEKELVLADGGQAVAESPGLDMSSAQVADGVPVEAITADNEVDGKGAEQDLFDYPEPGAQTSRLRRPDRVSPPSEDDWDRARKICIQAREMVRHMFADAKEGRPINAESITPVVSDIIDCVSDQPGTLTTLARLKSKDQYTFMHSVAVCALMTTLALELGLSDKQVYEAAMAGLLHDIGKILIDPEILNKPGKLSTEEYEEIKRHTTAGHRILKESGGIGEIPMDVCLHHHERVDGNGYPEALSDDNLSIFARMGTVCDVYDAITSERPYKKPWEPAVALHYMSKWAKGAYDSDVFRAFVKSLGVYPNGSLVLLSSGRLAVVMDQSQTGLLTPVVKVIYSVNSKMPITPVILALGEKGGRDKIVSREEPSKWGLTDLTKYWLPVELVR